MPYRAPRICGCGHRVPGGTRCACERVRKAEVDKRRASARERGYDARWERERAAFLQRAENRYCVCGCGRRADTVDHIIAHKGNQRLFWDRGNWQAMAYQCHSSKKQAAERRASAGAR